MAESRQQDKETRAVIVIARQTDTAVMLVIGNRQTEPVEMDEEGPSKKWRVCESVPIARAVYDASSGRQPVYV